MIVLLQALQPGAKTALDAATLQAIAGDVPLAELTRQDVIGQPLVQVMVAAGLQASKAASRRMIKVGQLPTSCPTCPTCARMPAGNSYCSLCWQGLHSAEMADALAAAAAGTAG